MKSLLVCAMFLVGLMPAFSQEIEEKQEKTLSPYFLVQNGEEAVESFPLLETKAKVNIAGVIADVELNQVYKNDGKTTIEAVYVFPMGTKAAIHKMKMKIGERTIEAKIEERNNAKVIYDTAKAAGKIASLLEQERPNVFQMKVANIMPGDKVEVAVNYTELLVPQEGVYEFVYPTVVGPRYGGGTSEEKDTDLWVANPYLHEGTDAPYGFDISVNLNTGIPINKVWVPTHKVDIKYDSKDRAFVQLNPAEKNGGNRDFVLRYGLEGDAIQTGVMLCPGTGENKENFFLLMAQPPKRTTPEDVPAREYVFIVDVSGSMHGFPLDISKSLITKLINGLREKDYFNILFFSGGSDVLSNTPLAANAENKARAIAMLSNQQGGGGTEILPAMKRVLSLEKKEGLSRTIIIATDGYVAVEKQVFDLIREHLSEANVFAFGIGTSVNRFIIEGMARVGKGESFVAENPSAAQKLAEKFSKYVSTPLLTDITMKTEGLDAYDIEPVSIPDLFAQRPLIVYGKYKNPQGSIIIQGKTGKGNYERTITITPGLQKKENSALKYLWAREKIARLDDYGKVGENVKDEVTKLGLQYSLMTQYTSFVAVDTVVRNTGESKTVKQPLPLPQGVSDYAVGEGSVGYAAMSVTGGRQATMACVDGKSLRKGQWPVQPANYAATTVESGDFVDKELANDIGEQYSPGLTKNEEEKKASIAANVKGHEVQVVSAQLPNGLVMQALEKQFERIRKDAEKLFTDWQLDSVTFTLSIEKGKVKKVTVKSYQGKECKAQELEKLLKKLAFVNTANGDLELELSR